MKKEINKKADIGWNYLLITIFLIVSFAIAFWLMSKADFGGTLDKEACHTSVILRASASSSILKMQFRDIVPLVCRSNGLCFSSSSFGEGCKSLGKGYDKISVGGDTLTKDKIVNELADNIYMWHNLLGRGIVNFMPREFTGTNYCFLNSLISFDDKTQKFLKDNKIKINMADVYTKLSQKKTKEGVNYFEDLFQSQLDAKTQYNQLAEMVIDPSQTYGMVTMMREDGKLKEWATFFGVGTATGVATNVILWTVFAPEAVVGTAVAVIGSGIIGGGAATYKVASDPDKTFRYNPPMIYPFNDEALSALKCDSFENLPL